MELSPDHVVLPKDNYLELQEAAFLSPAMTTQERLGSMAQVAVIFASIAGAATASVWGWAKAKDWLEERNFQRRVRSGEIHEKNIKKKAKDEAE